VPNANLIATSDPGSAALAETLGSHSGCGMFRPWFTS
jgi:hypothetical protein